MQDFQEQLTREKQNLFKPQDPLEMLVRIISQRLFGYYSHSVCPAHWVYFDISKEPQPQCFEKTCLFYTIEHMRRKVEVGVFRNQGLSNKEVFLKWAKQMKESQKTFMLSKNQEFPLRFEEVPLDDNSFMDVPLLISDAKI